MQEIDGTLLKKIRQNAGLFQRELADIIGVRQQTVCDYENGNYDIPYNRQQKVITALNVSDEEVKFYRNLTNNGGIRNENDSRNRKGSV